LSSRSYKNFNEYIETVKELITSYNDIIAIAELEEFEVTFNEGFIRGIVVFIDGSRLHFLEYIGIINNISIKLKYRYHYEDAEGNMIFRYDNAPHHRNIATFPHHKHVGNNVLPSREPSLSTVLEEVALMIR
jgi:hypothetical protein